MYLHFHVFILFQFFCTYWGSADCHIILPVCTHEGEPQVDRTLKTDPLPLHSEPSCPGPPQLRSPRAPYLQLCQFPSSLFRWLWLLLGGQTLKTEPSPPPSTVGQYRSLALPCSGAIQFPLLFLLWLHLLLGHRCIGFRIENSGGGGAGKHVMEGLRLFRLVESSEGF